MNLRLKADSSKHSIITHENLIVWNLRSLLIYKLIYIHLPEINGIKFPSVWRLTKLGEDNEDSSFLDCVQSVGSLFGEWENVFV